MALFKNKYKDILTRILVFLLVFSWFFSGWPLKIKEARAADKVIFLTIADSSPWTVPSDWTDVNTIVAIGGGGAGGSNTAGGGGGGGGAYSAITNLDLTAGNTAQFSVGATSTSGGNGNNTWFNASSYANCTLATVCVSAAGGSGAGTSQTGAAGGTTGGIGTTEYAGGPGGTGTNAGADSSGGGGGAGSPNGTGGTGGAGDTNTAGAEGSGGGGGSGDDSGTTDNGEAGTANGGAGGDSAGNANSGGAGGTGTDNGQPGTDGGGGGGADGDSGSADGGNGGAGEEWTGTNLKIKGAGGGGGGGDANSSGTDAVGGDGGNYGGGGGGGEAGGAGAAGLIIITYTPAAPSVAQNYYRWRNDDGTESTATGSNENTATSTNHVDSLLRLRAEAYNTGGAASNYTYRLEYGTNSNCTAGSWTAVATSTSCGTALFCANASQLTDGAVTTDASVGSLTNPGGGTWADGYQEEGEPTLNNTISLAASSGFTENEWSFKPTSYAVAGTTYYLRMSNSGTALNTYNVCPAVTIVNNPLAITASTSAALPDTAYSFSSSSTTPATKMPALRITGNNAANWSLTVGCNSPTSCLWKGVKEVDRINLNGDSGSAIKSQKGKMCFDITGTAALSAEAGSTSGMNLSSDDCFRGTSDITILSVSSPSGQGIYWVTDMTMQQLIPGGATATSYTTTLTFTVAYNNQLPAEKNPQNNGFNVLLAAAISGAKVLAKRQKLTVNKK